MGDTDVRKNPQPAGLEERPVQQEEVKVSVEEGVSRQGSRELGGSPTPAASL